MAENDIVVTITGRAAEELRRLARRRRCSELDMLGGALALTAWVMEEEEKGNTLWVSRGNGRIVDWSLESLKPREVQDDDDI